MQALFQHAVELKTRIKRLEALLLEREARIVDLEHRRNKYSGNRSTPSSSDGLKKRKVTPALPRPLDVVPVVNAVIKS